MENNKQSNNNQVNEQQKYNPNEFIALADKTYMEYIKGGRYKDIISAMSKFGNYTLRNQMLILQQCPHATRVNTMNGWNYNKRVINKGSQSIKILAPVFDSVVTANEGKIEEKKSKAVVSYKINSIFDISQTSMKENSLNEQTPKLDENIPIEGNFNTLVKALQHTLKSYSFALEDIEDNGKLDTRNHTIVIKSGLSKEQLLKTLVDQVAAALVLGRNRDNFKGLKSETLPELTTIEISAVSSIVSKKLGLENRSLQEPDFNAMTDEHIDKFADNLGLMRSVSQIMIMAIDLALEEAFAKEQLAQSNATTEGFKQQNNLRNNTKLQAELA